MEERLDRLNVVALVLVSFLLTAGFGAVNLIVPYYILALKGVLREPPEAFETLPGHKAVVEMGVMVAAFMGTRALVAAYSGGLSDIVGRKKLVTTGMAMYVAIGVAYSMTTAVWQLYLLRALQGVASALVWPVAEILLVESVPPFYRTRALGYYVMAMQLGHILGPPLGAVAYSISRMLVHGGPVEVLRAPFIVIALFALPGLILTLSIRETVEQPQRVSRRALIDAVTRVRSVFGELEYGVQRALKAFYINGLINGFAMGIVMSVLVAYILEFVAANPFHVALALTIAGLVGTLSVYPMARLADRLDSVAKKRLLVTLGLAGRAAIALLAFARDLPTLIAVLTLMEAFFNSFMPLMRSIQAELVPASTRGRVFGLQQAFFNLGMVVGPLVGSAIYRGYYNVTLLGLSGPQWVFIISAILGSTGVALIAWCYQPKLVAEKPPVVELHGESSPRKEPDEEVSGGRGGTQGR